MKFRSDPVREGDFRQESGHRLGKGLLAETARPNAIFICNGVMTLGVLRAFEELGLRYPEDVGLATFDDFWKKWPLSLTLRPSFS